MTNVVALVDVVLPAAISAAAVCILAYAALHDLAVRTVPNCLCVGLFSLGVLLRLTEHSLLDGLLMSAGTFLILFIIWALGAIGGGDVKLWAATALLIPPLWTPALWFFLRVIMFGGLLAIVYLLLCLVVRRPRASQAGGLLRRLARAEAWRISRRGPLPYALAISGSAILTLLPLSFNVR